MSRRTWSRVWPVCRARISSIWLRTRWISAAWISRSDTWPPDSPDGWWMSTREDGRGRRLQRDQLGHDVVRRRVVDLHPEEDDPLLEELVVRVGLLHAVARALHEG